MAENKPTREQAFDLLRKYNQTESLIKHALSVEGVMRYFARQYAEDHGINLIYLPPYSPDLNPIEFIWKSIKREISCEFIRDVDHMKRLIRENFYRFSARRSFAANWIKVFLGNELCILS